MLSKHRRIPRELFKPLIASKVFFNSPHFSLRVAHSTAPARLSVSNGARIAVSVSKKVSKKASTRNRTRRRAYAALREAISSLSNNLYLLIAKPGAEKLKGEELRAELVALFKKS